MRDRRIGINGLSAAQSHAPKFAVARLPVKRRGPAFASHRGPAVRKPQQRIAVSAIRDKFGPLAVRDQSIRQAVGFDLDGVARAFAIKRETLALVPDLDQSARKTSIGLRAVDEFDRQRDRFSVRRAQRILREQVQDIGQQEFLMLLLVMTAQLNDFQHPLRRRSLQQLRNAASRRIRDRQEPPRASAV